MKSPTVGSIAVRRRRARSAAPAERRRSMTASTLSVLRPLPSCAARTCRTTSRATSGRPCRRSAPGSTGPMPGARRDRDDGRAAARATRSRRARSRPTARSTHRSGPSRSSITSTSSVDVGIDGAGPGELDDEQRRIALLRPRARRALIERDVGRVEQTVDLHDVDAVRRRRRRRPAPRRGVGERERIRARTNASASSMRTSASGGIGIGLS